MIKYSKIDGLRRIKRLETFRPKMSLQDTIHFCIENGFKLDIEYEGENEDVLNGYRTVAPAAFGKHITTGNKVMRAYLLQGVSKSKKSPQWRLFRLDRIKKYNIFYSSTSVKKNKLYRMDDKHMAVIYAEIEKAFENLLEI